MSKRSELNKLLNSENEELIKYEEPVEVSDEEENNWDKLSKLNYWTLSGKILDKESINTSNPQNPFIKCCHCRCNVAVIRFDETGKFYWHIFPPNGSVVGNFIFCSKDCRLNYIIKIYFIRGK